MLTNVSFKNYGSIIKSKLFYLTNNKQVLQSISLNTEIYSLKVSNKKTLYCHGISAWHGLLPSFIACAHGIWEFIVRRRLWGSVYKEISF